MANKFFTDGSSDQVNNGGFSCIHYTEKSKTIYYGNTPKYELADIMILKDRIVYVSIDEVYVKPTNNRGELLGILIAAKIIAENNLKNSVIISDSKYCIGVYTKWLQNWKSNKNLMTNKLNLDIILYTDELLQGSNTTFIHQPAHKNSSNELNTLAKFNIDMNCLADKYAVLGKSLDTDESIICT
jgi:ribonuclease HI